MLVVSFRNAKAIADTTEIINALFLNIEEVRDFREESEKMGDPWFVHTIDTVYADELLDTKKYPFEHAYVMEMVAKELCPWNHFEKWTECEKWLEENGYL